MSARPSRTDHAAALVALPLEEWSGYLAAHSGLPGPRADLGLAQAVADTADAATLRAFAADDDEFTALCGVIGLGRLLAETDGGEDAAAALDGELRMRASDARWRVREGVAMALQRLGDADPSRLWRLVERWTAEAELSPEPREEGELLVLRAVAAGIAEPRLVKQEHDALRGQRILDRATAVLVGTEASGRRAEGFRVLRQTLGYAWSVVLVGAPAEGFDALERWVATGDPDAMWLVRENLKKSRLLRADPERAAALAAHL